MTSPGTPAAEPTWTLTRSQLINAINGITVKGAALDGYANPVVVADDMADAILEQIPPDGPEVFPPHCCGHSGVLHDVWTFDEPYPRCCVEGCECGADLVVAGRGAADGSDQ